MDWRLILILGAGWIIWTIGRFVLEMLRAPEGTLAEAMLATETPRRESPIERQRKLDELFEKPRI